MKITQKKKLDLMNGHGREFSGWLSGWHCFSYGNRECWPHISFGKILLSWFVSQPAILTNWCVEMEIIQPIVELKFRYTLFLFHALSISRALLMLGSKRSTSSFSSDCLAMSSSSSIFSEWFSWVFVRPAMAICWHLRTLSIGCD